MQFFLSFRRSNLISSERVTIGPWKSQFFLSFSRSNLISCERVATDNLELAILPQFWTIEPHFVRKGCDGRLGNRNFTSVFDDRTSFRAKGFAGNTKSQFFLSFWRSNLISCERVAADTLKSQFYYLSFGRSNLISCERDCADKLEIAILPQFLAIEPHFVRKGCVSWRLVGIAPAPAFKREIEKKEKARGQEGKRARGEKM